MIRKCFCHIHPIKVAIQEHTSVIINDFFLIMAALRSRCGHYILPCDLFFLLLFSSTNLSRRTLDVCHTSTHCVALVGIYNACLKCAARHSSSGRQANFVALNRGLHLYSAGRPSRWVLALICSVKLLWPLVIFEHAHLDSRTDSRALRAEYCIVGIPHNTAI